MRKPKQVSLRDAGKTPPLDTGKRKPAGPVGTRPERKGPRVKAIGKRR